MDYSKTLQKHIIKQKPMVLLHSWVIKFSHSFLAATFFNSSLVVITVGYLPHLEINFPESINIFFKWIFVIYIFDKPFNSSSIWINQPVRPSSHYFFKDKNLISSASRNSLMDYIHYNSRTWIFLQRIDRNWHRWKMPSQNK